ncbi:hypothetical protein CRENBAI_005360 [Crenichthys baileyi]|uniref:Uncharacterized protein n=1 Tax=Crenichthys baileyi TaxID=28760 RepID=A0AAV9SES4_9TELE
MYRREVRNVPLRASHLRKQRRRERGEGAGAQRFLRRRKVLLEGLHTNVQKLASCLRRLVEDHANRKLCQDDQHHHQELSPEKGHLTLVSVIRTRTPR